ncbi:MAG TPA: GNAT family N-acetyltransferase [Ktedonobacteraceae bacterium]|jgi:GNAT superfamily N-acetyltransferase|nr:GNAT family N-acetyltransferase [Ktedonobacteraceae bacterium]
MTSEITVQPVGKDDRAWVEQFVRTRWGSDYIVAHGTAYEVRTLPGLLAWWHDERAGLLTYHVEDDECEIVTLDSLHPTSGVGTALIDAIKAQALHASYKRLWLITTNDNLRALRFYQRRGLVLVAVHRNAIAQSRKLKPQIPELGQYDIPLRDEIELEFILDTDEYME